RIFDAARAEEWAAVVAEQDRLARLFEITGAATPGRVSAGAAGLGGFQAALRLMGVIGSNRMAAPMEGLARGGEGRGREEGDAPRTGSGRCGRSRRVHDRPAPHGRHRLEPDGRTDGGPRRRRGGEGPRDRHRRRTAVRLPGIIAVDVGGTKIRAGSVVDGVLGHVRTVPTPASAGAQEILDTIAEAAAAVIAEPGRGGEDGTDRDAEAGHSAATGPGRGAAVSEWRIG